MGAVGRAAVVVGILTIHHVGRTHNGYRGGVEATRCLASVRRRVRRADDHGAVLGVGARPVAPAEAAAATNGARTVNPNPRTAR